jgi:hypothetical protein
MFPVMLYIHYWPDDGVYSTFECVHVECDEYSNWKRNNLGLYEWVRFRYTGTSNSIDRFVKFRVY